MTTDDAIPACPECEGDGCRACLGTGLTAEDCDFSSLARIWIEEHDRALEPLKPGIMVGFVPGPHG